MKEFLQDRIRLVNELFESEIRIHYADLALILCTVLSSCSALRWPGERIDRRRFIELLIQQSPAEAHTSWVSIPALINKGLISESETSYGAPGQSTRIFRDEEIDLSLHDAAIKYPRLKMRDLKQSTYAALIYAWLRCGYAHQYSASEYVTHIEASSSKARLSYIGRNDRMGLKRMTSFHLDYLIALAEFHARSLPESTSPQPRQWWLDIA